MNQHTTGLPAVQIALQKCHSKTHRQLDRTIRPHQQTTLRQSSLPAVLRVAVPRQINALLMVAFLDIPQH